MGNHQGLKCRTQRAGGLKPRFARQADGEAAERLFGDLSERLDVAELDGWLDQPAEMVIAAICRDLRLVRPAAPEDAISADDGAATMRANEPDG